MAELNNVTLTFAARDLLSGVLSRYSTQLLHLDRQVASLQVRLQALGSVDLSGLEKVARTLSEISRAVRPSLAGQTKVGPAASRDDGRILDVQRKQLELLEKQLAVAEKSAEVLKEISSATGEPYKIRSKETLLKIGSVDTSIVKSSLSAASKLENERLTLQQKGVSPQEIQSRAAEARRVSTNVKGATELETFRNQELLLGSFSPEVAKDLLPLFTQYAVQTEQTPEQLQDLVEALKLRTYGKNEADQKASAKSNLEFYAKLQKNDPEGFNGTKYKELITSGNYRNMSQAAIAMEVGVKETIAGKPGTDAFLASIEKLKTGRLTPQMAKSLAARGLLDEKKINWNKDHTEITGLQLDAFKDSKEFNTNPYAWVQSHLVKPIFDSTIGKDGEKGRAQFEAEIARALGGQNNRHFAPAAQLFDQAMQNNPRRTVTESKEIGESYVAKLQTYAGAQQKFNAALENLQVRVGEKLLPWATKFIDKLADLLTGLSTFMDDNPVLSGRLVKGGAAIGGLAGLAGGLLWLKDAWKKDGADGKGCCCEKTKNEARIVDAVRKSVKANGGTSRTGFFGRMAEGVTGWGRKVAETGRGLFSSARAGVASAGRWVSETAGRTFSRAKEALAGGGRKVSEATGRVFSGPRSALGSGGRKAVEVARRGYAAARSGLTAGARWAAGTTSRTFSGTRNVLAAGGGLFRSGRRLLNRVGGRFVPGLGLAMNVKDAFDVGRFIGDRINGIGIGNGRTVSDWTYDLGGKIYDAFQPQAPQPTPSKMTRHARALADRMSAPTPRPAPPPVNQSFPVTVNASVAVNTQLSVDKAQQVANQAANQARRLIYDSVVNHLNTGSRPSGTPGPLPTA